MRINFLEKDITANGGIERVVVTLANNLSKFYNYNIKIISINKSYKESIVFDIDNNIEVIFLDYENKYKDSIRSCVSELIFINKYIKKNKVDILITTCTYHNVYVAFLKKFLDIKVIASHHEEYSSDTEKWNKLKKMLYKNLDAVVTLTKFDYYKYKKFNDNVFVIPNAISFERKYQYNKNSKKIITLSRLSIEKSIDYSIKAFERLNKKYSDWELEIVGDGPDRDRLEKIIKNHKLEEFVKISEFEKDVTKKYREAAFTVLTSQKEGFGCILIESKAVGVPVVSFENIGPNEIIQKGIDGFIVEKNNIKELAETMEKLINNKDLRIEMSKKAYLDSEKYTIDKICNRWNKIIKSLSCE